MDLTDVPYPCAFYVGTTLKPKGKVNNSTNISKNPTAGFIINSNNSNYSNVRYYSVRVYNRILTEEDIAYNYAVDKERFGL